MIVLRGANSAFYKEGINYADGAEGCFRMIYLRHLGIDLKPQNIWDKFSQMVTFGIGKANEQIMVEYLKLTRPDDEIIEEEECNFEIDGEIKITGHIDLQQNGVVFETKMVSSVNSYYKFFVENTPKLNNVAQLCTYLYAKEKDKGVLRYTNCIWAPKMLHIKEDRELPVMRPQFKDFIIDICGNSVYNNMEEFEYTITNLLDHKREAYKRIKEPSKLETKEGGNRPKNRAKTCSYCPLSKNCTRMEKCELNIEQWVEESKKFSELCLTNTKKEY